jgi:2-C-methyl-D-erythritol 4-phosphate cytidylyltransferase
VNIAIIIAAGKGTRMRQDIPKQFLTVNDKPVIVYTLEAFQQSPLIDEIVVVTLQEWRPILETMCRQFGITKFTETVSGGDTGQESIFNGITAVSRNHDPNDIVLIHDGIRPFVSQEIIADCVKKSQIFGNATAVIPCAEVMLQTSDGELSTATYPRDNLKRTQTPQGFHLGEIVELHRQAIERGIHNALASCDLMIRLGNEVHFSLGSEKNVKLTTTDDLDIFRALLSLEKSNAIK